MLLFYSNHLHKSVKSMGNKKTAPKKEAVLTQKIVVRLS